MNKLQRELQLGQEYILQIREEIKGRDQAQIASQEIKLPAILEPLSPKLIRAIATVANNTIQLIQDNNVLSFEKNVFGWTLRG
jgi:hypothetical protein